MVKLLKIGIDFDRVLFDTDRFKERLREEIEGFEDTYEDAKDENGYSHLRHAEIADEEVESFEKVIERAEKFLFEDVGELEAIDHRVLVLTRGEPEHQIEKIRNSGTHHIADQVHVVNGDPEKNPKDIVDIDLLVDDQMYELEPVEVETFHFDREKHGMEDLLEKIKQLEGEK